jgi:hypothetical protein
MHESSIGASHGMTPRAALPRAAWVLVFAAGATLAAWAVFARMPPMAVRVGRDSIGASVPLGYQLSVFPAFGAFLGALAYDVARRTARRSWLPRAALVLGTGALASARLAGALPISGHAVFLFAALAYVVSPPEHDVHVLAAILPGLLVVGWCKLVVWGDPVWFVASAALGAAIGAGLARVARA